MCGDGGVKQWIVKRSIGLARPRACQAVITHMSREKQDCPTAHCRADGKNVATAIVSCNLSTLWFANKGERKQS